MSRVADVQACVQSAKRFELFICLLMQLAMVDEMI
jgi:hypothetical protein